MSDGVLEESQRIACVRRSNNAITCRAPVKTASGGRVFVKVAPLVAENADPVAVDAANSLIMTRIDPESKWTVALRDVRLCDVDRDDVATITDAAESQHLALAFSVVKGDDFGGVDKLDKFEDVTDRVRTLLRHLITAGTETGFVHNDLHVGNVMMGSKGTLRVIDYGRVHVDASAYAGFRDKVDEILGLGNNSIRAAWSPFLRDKDLRYSFVYWMADLITLSMQMYTGIRKGALSRFNNTKATFFERTKRVDSSTRIESHDYAPAFVNRYNLTVKATKMNPALAPIVPGLTLFAILLNAIPTVLGPHTGFAECFYPNFVLNQNGGKVLLALFDRRLMAEYGGVLELVFKDAGLEDAARPALVRLSRQNGSGAPRMEYFDYDDGDGDGDDYDGDDGDDGIDASDDGMGDYVIPEGEKFFPTDMGEAAEWAAALSVPDEDRFVEGPAAPDTRAEPAFVAPFRQGITAGGGAARSGVLPVVLGAIVLAMSLVPR